MISREQFKDTWSELHNSAPTTGIVGAWLAISYRFGLLCTLLRITPNVLTLLGLLSAIGVALTSQSLWAIALIVVSLFFDGIDGSVAIFQSRTSNWGAILDSVIDRMSEAFWLYALYSIGVPAYLCISLWLVASVQEYMRARVSSLGVKDLGLVTFTERPVRASFLFIVLIAWHLELPGIEIASWAFLGASIFSAISVMRFAYSRLR
ncbi:MAG: CDP-alcohol phosphatidyltransferase family protein [Actinobacteria bacterium]|nr:CDP-alcohol phosphatidyltransferase family protein [Actinomycetota bacterium]NDA95481.1 CDP-alcohol phosphatidyltransferase family protein [Actinomycetota bacterium]NDH81133.1 CDP-alcohol phosphatidyltransferase family protein [Actinomycetota bacterium]NDH99508.1 CDP-alcohol phosphatidyltransferase family protein [Actinomycetota bacterium]NDI08022.1 CDP-alcohol phosphatidyltransferase family protein [Actinomycetota bacterium]